MPTRFGSIAGSARRVASAASVSATNAASVALPKSPPEPPVPRSSGRGATRCPPCRAQSRWSVASSESFTPPAPTVSPIAILLPVVVHDQGRGERALGGALGDVAHRGGQDQRAGERRGLDVLARLDRDVALELDQAVGEHRLRARLGLRAHDARLVAAAYRGHLARAGVGGNELVAVAVDSTVPWPDACTVRCTSLPSSPTCAAALIDVSMPGNASQRARLGVAVTERGHVHDRVVGEQRVDVARRGRASASGHPRRRRA